MATPHQLIRSKLIDRYESLHYEHESYRWWILANIMIGTFMAVLDSTIINVSLPKIMASFGVSVDKVEWITTAYMLIQAVMLPTSGWIADHFGYKKTYFWALSLFTLGSLLCGLAWDENSLIVFRVIQGAGAGLMMPVGMAIVTREFPLEQRGLALGFWGIASAASVSFGPLIGGYLVDNFSWQAIFYVNIPVGLIGMLATLVIQREYKTEHIRSFDIIGFFSMSIFLCFLLIALADGNAAWNIGGWTSSFIITCFVTSFIGFIIFLFTELTIEHPLIDLSLFKYFNFTMANLLMLIFGLGMFGSTFLLPLYLQNSLGYTALQAGAVFLPVGLLQGCLSPISGLMADKVNPKIPAILGILLMTLSMYLNSFLSLFSEQLQIMIPLFIRGIGMGLVFTPLSTITLSEIPKHKMAQASGMSNVVRFIGGSFGVAILTTLLTQRMAFHTAVLGQSLSLTSPTFATTLERFMNFIQHSIGGQIYNYTIPVINVTLQAEYLIIQHVVSQAFIFAMNDVFLVVTMISLIGVIPIFFLRTQRTKDKKTTTETFME